MDTCFLPDNPIGFNWPSVPKDLNIFSNLLEGMIFTINKHYLGGRFNSEEDLCYVVYCFGEPVAVFEENSILMKVAPWVIIDMHRRNGYEI